MSYQEDSEKRIAQATADGFDVIERAPDELLVDLDSTPLDDFERRLERMQSAGWYVAYWEFWESKTAGHHHALVKLALTKRNPSIEPIEAIALQAALGSDPAREGLALHDLRQGNPHFSVLFRPGGAQVRRLYGAGSRSTGELVGVTHGVRLANSGAGGVMDDYTPKLKGRCTACRGERPLVYVKTKVVGFVKVCEICREAMEKRGVLLKPDRVIPMENQS